jgi:hypothetical protein
MSCTSRPSNDLRLTHGRRSRQPPHQPEPDGEPHAHLELHRRRGGEVLACLLAFPGAPEELAEAEMPVGSERAHPAQLASALR